MSYLVNRLSSTPPPAAAYRGQAFKASRPQVAEQRVGNKQAEILINATLKSAMRTYVRSLKHLESLEKTDINYAEALSQKEEYHKQLGVILNRLPEAEKVEAIIDLNDMIDGVVS